MVNTVEITDRRFHDWKVTLAKKHATPALLVAFGKKHDHNSGAITILIPDSDLLSVDEIRRILATVLNSIDGGLVEITQIEKGERQAR